MSQLKKMSGWDDRGNGDEGAIADAQRLWLGNLAKDLSKNAFVDWLKEVGFEALEILPLVTGVMMAENMISDTECPHPTVTPNLAVLSVRTCSRNCRDAPTPPSPQIFQNLRWLNMFGKMSHSLTSALVRCPSVWTPRPSHELSLHLLVWGGRIPHSHVHFGNPLVGLVFVGR